MKTQTDKAASKKSKAVANTSSDKKNKKESEVQFEDNRAEVVAQRRLWGMADNSTHTSTVAQLQAIVNDTSPEPVQKQGLVEDEELLQGIFVTIQKQGPEEEEPLQGKFETIQKQGPEEEELLQGKFETIQKQRLEEEEALQGKFETIQKQGLEEEEIQVKSAIGQKKEQKPANNTGLPDTLKSGIENLSGLSLDDVKVHYNSPKPAQLQAHAFAQGTDIHMAPGQEKHLPHEAWHVVQQKQGRVKPTKQMKGKVNVNDDAGLEKEADVMGARAIEGTNSSSPLLQGKGMQPRNFDAVQMKEGDRGFSASDRLVMQSEVDNSPILDDDSDLKKIDAETDKKSMEATELQKGGEAVGSRVKEVYDNPVKGNSDEERIELAGRKKADAEVYENPIKGNSDQERIEIAARKKLAKIVVSYTNSLDQVCSEGITVKALNKSLQSMIKQGAAISALGLGISVAGAFATFAPPLALGLALLTLFPGVVTTYKKSKIVKKKAKHQVAMKEKAKMGTGKAESGSSKVDAAEQTAGVTALGVETAGDFMADAGKAAGKGLEAGAAWAGGAIGSISLLMAGHEYYKAEKININKIIGPEFANAVMMSFEHFRKELKGADDSSQYADVLKKIDQTQAKVETLLQATEPVGFRPVEK